MTRIAIFASGSGSNAENLIRNVTEGRVVLLLCNNPKASVLERARKLGVPAVVFTAAQLEQKGMANQNNAHKPNIEVAKEGEKSVLDILRDYKIDLILLAGFLWKIPQHLLEAFPSRILNIHPALLPRYGGKGMYGNKVHEAVLKDMATESRNAATESRNAATESRNAATESRNAAKASSVRAMKSSFLTAKASSATVMASSTTEMESSNAAKASSIRAMNSSFLTAMASSATVMASSNAATESRNAATESRNAATESRNAADPVVGTSGITIHLIDQYYDKGEILFQATCPVLQTDTVETLAQKVHALEYKHFPQITDQYITTLHKQHTK